MADGSVSGCTVMDNTDASMPLIDMYRVSVDDVEEDVVTQRIWQNLGVNCQLN